MSVDAVSKVFEFVLANGEFTESVLFSTEEIPELKQEEREAIKVVTPHIRDSYVDLLTSCRQAFLDAAGATAKNRSTMERNENRPDTIWERTYTEIPLVIRSAWEARVQFGLWSCTSESGRPIKLFANIHTQARHFSILRALAQERKLDLRPAERSCRMGRIALAEGDSFAKVSSDLATQVWPVTSELYDRIMAVPTT